MGEYSSEMTSERDRDLGIGSRVADMSVRRLLNRDGSFNTKRKGLGLIGSLSLYNRLFIPSMRRARLRKMTQEDCLKADVEILLLLTGMDETFSQTVHARSSYKPDETSRCSWSTVPCRRSAYFGL
jgi:hypothetical protein